ncbi:hypothetical protein [Massilia niabensis]|uniref:Transposase n=1 Tax=Massilia niabensis TaxID=544910 RepID=A0ABW0L0U3_9BURK
MISTARPAFISSIAALLAPLLSIANLNRHDNCRHSSLYTWTKRYGVPEEERKAVDSQADEMRRLKTELKRVTEERNILRKAAV